MVGPVNSSNTLEAVLRRNRQVVASALVTAFVASWLYLLAGAGTGMYPHEMAVLIPPQSSISTLMPPRMWTPAYALLMFSMWWLMMIAMMLPSAAPMVLLQATITRNGLRNDGNAGSTSCSSHIHSTTTAFMAGYLAMWATFSLVAVIAQWGLERSELLSAAMMPTSKLLGAGLLLATGVWQLTPLKAVCLHHCRSPIGFLATHWRPGIRGAFRMGIELGVFCLGCCWFLMALLFYAGVMNLIWIVGLALYVLVEKMLPAGAMLGRLTGLLLVVWGVWVGFSAL